MDEKPLLEGEGQPSIPPGPPTASVPSGSSGPAQGPPLYPANPQPLPQSQPPPGQGLGSYGAIPTVVAHQPQTQSINPDLSVKPPDYLVLNIIVMLCCFFCFFCGLAGMLAGLQVDNAWKAGEREKAYQHSRTAQSWGIRGIIGGCVAQTVFVAFVIVVGVIGGIIAANN